MKAMIREVAEQEGISPTVLEAAWKNQFKQVRKTISSSTKNDIDTFKVVYLRYFGKFIPKLAALKKMRDASKS